MTELFSVLTDVSDIILWPINAMFFCGFIYLMVESGISFLFLWGLLLFSMSVPIFLLKRFKDSPKSRSRYVIWLFLAFFTIGIMAKMAVVPSEAAAYWFFCLIYFLAFFVSFGDLLLQYVKERTT